MQCARTALLLAGVLGLTSAGSRAEPPAPETLAPPSAAAEILPPEEFEWVFDATVYLWMYQAHAGGSVDTASLQFDSRFFDQFTNSDTLLAVPLHLEARRRRWSFVLDPIYLYASASASLLGFGAKLRGHVLVIDALAAYRATDWRAFGEVGEAAGMLHLEPLLGGRYLHIDGSINPDFLPGRSTVIGRFDPLLGGRARLGLSERLKLEARGDVGGFGVGSEFTWEVWANFFYRFELAGIDLDAVLGYRALYQDHDLRGGDTLDILIHGPILGLNANF